MLIGSTLRVASPTTVKLSAARDDNLSWSEGERLREARLQKDETAKIRLAIAEDQRFIRRMVNLFVDAQPDMELIGEAENGREALELCERLAPDVMLMDISMPEMDGIEATRRLRDLSPNTAVLILSSYSDEGHVFEGVKAGARGYLDKNGSPEEVADAIRTVNAGGSIMSPALAEETLETLSRTKEKDESRAAPHLTNREIEIIRAIAGGKSSKQIARSLSISERTVRNHASNIYKKLHIYDRTQAVLYAVRRGLVDPHEPGGP